VTSSTLVPSSASVHYNTTTRRITVEGTVVTAGGAPGAFATVFVDVLSGPGVGTSFGGFRTSGSGAMHMSFVPSGLGEVVVVLSIYFSGPSVRPISPADSWLQRAVSVTGEAPCTDSSSTLPADWRTVSGVSCDHAFLGLCAASASVLG
jgi:hypothetical protein